MRILSLSLLGALLAGLLLGCSGADDSAQSEQPASADPITKEGAGKADAVDKMCKQLGKKAGCDLCEAAQWYNDGSCDDFCTKLDGDCNTTQELKNLCTDWQSGVVSCYATPGKSLEECGFGAQGQRKDRATVCCDTFKYPLCEELLHPSPSGAPVRKDYCTQLHQDLQACVGDKADKLPSCLPAVDDEGYAGINVCCIYYDLALCPSLPDISEPYCEILDGSVGDCVFEGLELKDCAPKPGTVDYDMAHLCCGVSGYRFCDVLVEND